MKTNGWIGAFQGNIIKYWEIISHSMNNTVWILFGQEIRLNTVYSGLESKDVSMETSCCGVFVYDA